MTKVIIQHIGGTESCTKGAEEGFSLIRDSYWLGVPIPVAFIPQMRPLAQWGSDITMTKGAVDGTRTGRGGFRERLFYVFRTFPNKSCNCTVLQRSDHQKHVVQLTFVPKYVKKHVVKLTLVLPYVKTRRTINISFVHMSKLVVHLTVFLQMCQNMSYN